MRDLSAWNRITEYAAKPQRHLIGLMSGTSVDGVDAALVRVSGSGRETMAELLGFITHPIPADLRSEILAISHGEGNAETVSYLNVRIGHQFAQAASAVLRSVGWVYPVDAIASHGHTISHTPHHHATLQIGEPVIIAQEHKVPVVSDFRAADIAAGGQGAPLVPYADWCLLTHPTKSRAIQNIGGIGNVTYLPANAQPAQVIGFDTGPGNMLIDRAVHWATGGSLTYDPDGHRAAQGQIVPDLLERLLATPFLQKQPPKSAGREEFGDAYFTWLTHGAFGDTVPATDQQNDLIATLTAFTAVTIADAYRRFLPALPDEVIIGGGGARNPTLLRLLAAQLAPIPILIHEDIGLNSDAKEALAFCVLANETLLGNPSNLPSVTGATRPVLQGKVTLP